MCCFNGSVMSENKFFFYSLLKEMRFRGVGRGRKVALTCTASRYPQLPNVIVEWLTLLFRVREAPCSNLASESVIVSFFCGFRKSYQANAG
jgi:hypothetical protein